MHRVLSRHGLAKLAWLDLATGRCVRPYEWAAPGEMVHVDIKKLPRIPNGGGHRIHGRSSAQHQASKRQKAGYARAQRGR